MKRWRRHLRKKPGKRRARIAVTVGAAALAVSASVQAWAAEETAIDPPDPHQLPVACDADGDLLANSTERALGFQPFRADQNRNAIRDGAELARRCSAVVAGLPVYIPGTLMPVPDGSYKIEHALDGLEQCDICGQLIHMGGWEIINPRLNLHYPDPCDPLDDTFLPDLALHYMDHGSFDCYGEWHRGRTQVARLAAVIEVAGPYWPDRHELPVPDDADGDLLNNEEELAALHNLHDADQNDNLIPDGVELARQCALVIDNLPQYHPGIRETYRIDHPTFGVYECDTCGEPINMGFIEVVNPRQADATVYVLYMAMHYMQHGSFTYAGEALQGRAEVTRMLNILEMPRRCGQLGTLYRPADLDHNCSVDLPDLSALAQDWLKNTDPHSDETTDHDQ